MHTVVWQARQSEDNCLSFPISLVFFFSCFLTSSQAILLHVKRTKRMEVRGVWSGVDFVFLFFCPPPLFSSLHRLYYHGGPSARGRAEDMTTFRPNPHLFLHTVMMEMVSEKTYWVSDVEEQSRRERKCEVGIVEMSRQVRMHWFRITFLFHFNCHSGRTQSWFLAWDPISAPYK